MSSTVTPSAAIGTAMLSTIRPSSGSSYGNIVDSTVPTGDWLAKILRPLTWKPPSTFVALAPGPGRVGAARRHQHDPVVGDPPQRRLGTGQAAAVAPRREQHHVVVHRRREGGRRAVTGQLTLGHRDLADRGALSTELGGDREGQVAGGPDLVVRLGDEGAVTIVTSGVASDPAAELGSQGDELALSVERCYFLCCAHASEGTHARFVQIVHFLYSRPRA